MISKLSVIYLLLIYSPTNQVSYAIGVAEPLSITVFDYGTGTKSSQELMKIVRENFDLRSVYHS